ncbi:MAG: hypothetical protein PHU56_00395, partial [Candidatus Pacebacteria bacterium]|nr:hypothetical protein [Candidatus Paceibacterota bacterium]
MAFLKKYLKAPIALLVCLVLILQMAPDLRPAQAAGFWDTVKKIASRIALPNNINFTKEGKLEMASWGTVDLGFDGNPFDRMSLPLGGSPKQLIDPDTKMPAIANPEIPEECELRIKRPGDENDCSSEDLSDTQREACEEELIAHRSACTQFIRLQKAAAQEAWIAKKIYNNTNPYDECFFLKNCRSKCYLSYGELKYVITWLDIAQFLLPTSWITVVKKVMGVIAALDKIKTAYDSLKSLLTDGIKLVNGFFTAFNYLSNMFAALDNIGGTMSAAIGVAAVVGSGTIEGLNLKVPFNSMQYGAAAGTAAILAADSKGINSMTEMLKNFSDNLLRYSSAKSETNAYVLGIRRDLTALLEGDVAIQSKGAKHEQELAYFFEPNNEVKKNLDQIVLNFQGSFKQLSSLLDNAVAPGQLPEGPVTELAKGTGEQWTSFKEDVLDKNEAPVLDFKNWENESGGITSVYLSDTAFGDRNIRNKDDFCSVSGYNGSSDAGICMFNGDRVRPWEKAVCQPDELLLETNSELKRLTEPDYVKSVLKSALGAGCAAQDRYCMARLRDGNEWKQPWVDYWIELRRLTLGPDNGYTLQFAKPDQIQTEVLKTKMTTESGEIQLYGFLSPLSKLDDENGTGKQNKNNNISDYSKKGALSNTEEYIDYNYAALRFNSFIFSNGSFCDPEKVQNRTWLDNFTQIFKDTSALQANFNLIDPDQIEKMLIGEGTSILVCAKNPGACKLDYSVQEWREYWEKLALQLAEPGWVENTIDGLGMEDAHSEMIKKVLELTGGSSNSLLAYIAYIEKGTS